MALTQQKSKIIHLFIEQLLYVKHCQILGIKREQSGTFLHRPDVLLEYEIDNKKVNEQILIHTDYYSYNKGKDI